MKKMNVSIFRLMAIGVFVLCASIMSGCAVGTTHVKIAHNPIQSIVDKKEGTFLVKPFVDARKQTSTIGNKRNGFGMVLGHIGALEGVDVGERLTDCFIEALNEVGYSADLYDETKDYSKEKYDAVVEGQIVEFWMDLYMAVWHRVGVDVTVMDAEEKNVLWQKLISGAEKRVLGVGATAEYERIIREAITKTLNQAAVDFSSDDFTQSVLK